MKKKFIWITLVFALIAQAVVAGQFIDYMQSTSADSAESGVLRLSNTDEIKWRNAADSADLAFGVSTSDAIQYLGVDLADISSAQTLTTKTIDADNNTISNLAHGAEVDNPSSGVHGVTGSVVGTTDTQVLTGKDIDGGTASNTSRITLPKDTTTNLDLLTDKEGTVAFNSTIGSLVVNDGTGWDQISGSGGAGVKSYLDDAMTNLDADSTADFEVYDDTGAYVDGTGGTPTGLSIVTTNTAGELLGKTYSLKISKAASDASGEGVSILTRTIEREDYGRTLWGELELDFTGANYTSGDISVKAYDVTNSAELAVIAITQDDSSIPNSQGKFQFKVITTGTSGAETKSVRISLHLESDSATGSAYDLFVDDYKLGPHSSQPGFISEDFGTLTTTGSWSNTTYTGQYYRRGDRLHGIVKLAMSALPAYTALTIDLPSGYVMDTDKLTGGTSIRGHINAKGSIYESGGDNWDISALYNTTTSIRIMVDSVTTSLQSSMYTTLPFTVGNGDSVYIEYDVPIVDWKTSNLVSTQEALFSTAFVVAETDGGGQAFASGSYVAIDYDTALSDDFSIMSGTGTSWKATPVKAGWQTVNAAARFATATGWALGEVMALQASRYNSAAVLQETKTLDSKESLTSDSSASSTNWDNLNGSVDMEFAKGDYLKILLFQNNGASLVLDASTDHNYFSMKPIEDKSVYGTYGETELIEASATVASYVITAATWGDLTSIEVPPGEWDFDIRVLFKSNGVTTTGGVLAGLSTVSGNNSPGDEGVDSAFEEKATTTSTRTMLDFFKKGVIVTDTTTYYLKTHAEGSITNLQVAYVITARRIK